MLVPGRNYKDWMTFEEFAKLTKSAIRVEVAEGSSGEGNVHELVRNKWDVFIKQSEMISEIDGMIEYENEGNILQELQVINDSLDILLKKNICKRMVEGYCKITAILSNID